MALPKMPRVTLPRVMRATSEDIGEGRYPKALLVACASWVLLGVVVLLSRVGSPNATDQQETDAATGVIAVRPPETQLGAWVNYIPWLGVVVIVVAVLLFLGFSWARLVLALLGLIAVVALAMIATWVAVPAAVLFVVGAVCSVLISTHRYLMRPRAGDQPADPESTRVVS